MAKPKRTYVVVGFDVVAMRWRPMYRCETLERAEALIAPLMILAVFVQLWSLACDIEDVEAIEELCRELPPIGLAAVFTAYADVADHAFTLGGGRFRRHLPKETTLH